MDAQPGGESEDSRHWMVASTDLRYGGVAADHCHDAFVEIGKGLLFHAGGFSDNVVRTVPPGLLSHGCQLGQWLAVFALSVGKISQRIHTGVTCNREIWLHIDATTTTWLNSQRTG